MALFHFVDVSRTSEFRRWDNQYGCVGLDRAPRRRTLAEQLISTGQIHSAARLPFYHRRSIDVRG